MNTEYMQTQPAPRSEADDILDKIKSGELIPDSIFGWSSKSLLAGLVLFMLIRR